MEKQFERTVALIGESAFSSLQKVSVLIVGLGGVGGYAFEALVRAGVGNITTMDGDSFSQSNLNRQILATYETLGKNKAETAAIRAAQINTFCSVTAIPFFYNEENAQNIDLTRYDYIIDAIDNLPDKALLIKNAKKAGTDIISSMGTANRLEINYGFCDIYQTTCCPLARKLRSLLRKEGVTEAQVLISCAKVIQEKVIAPLPSISYAPAAAGLLLAQKVLLSLLDKAKKE